MTTSTDTEGGYAHLHPKARAQLELSDKERIKIIQAGSWMPLDHAKRVLERMEELRDHPRVTRMPNLLLIGASFSGKTTIIEHFLEANPPDHDPESDLSRCPVIMVEAPPRPHIGDFYSRILDKLMAPYKHNAKDEEKLLQIKRLFQQLGVRVLIIDEIHHLIAGSLRLQREFRNAIKSLGNLTKICMVAAGTEEAHAAINLDAQLSSRFQPVLLPKWRPGADMGSLLATLERRIPLKRPSDLKSVGMMLEIDARAEQTLGDICDLVRTAGVQAIRSGTEQITLAALKELDWVAPSKRKMYAPSL